MALRGACDLRMHSGFASCACRFGHPSWAQTSTVVFVDCSTRDYKFEPRIDFRDQGILTVSAGLVGRFGVDSNVFVALSPLLPPHFCFIARSTVHDPLGLMTEHRARSIVEFIASYCTGGLSSSTGDLRRGSIRSFRPSSVKLKHPWGEVYQWVLSCFPLLPCWHLTWGRTCGSCSPVAHELLP